MFEKKLKDFLPPSPAISAPQAVVPVEMCVEERDLQNAKLGELRYVSFLLEKLCWLTAPGSKEFSEYRKTLRREMENGISK